MGNLKLYQYSHIGTKDLVERYIQTALSTLNALVEASGNPLVHGISMKDIYDNLLAARQSFGRSALLLSGGGTFGMNHIGVVKSLWEVKLLPRIISGASAGSIVAAVTCTTTDEEVPELLENFCYGDLAVFNSPDEEDSWLKKVARVLTVGSMFDIAHLKRVMQGLLGNLTFLEAYNRTRRILNICVSSSSVYELPKLLNYITSPNIVIWSAVAASCSVPVVFSPASLLMKDPKTHEIGHWTGDLTPQKWIDGSVENDIPMQRLSEMFNVNHFIVSQVNPHVIPFLIREKDVNLDEDDRSTFAPSPSWVQGLSTFARSEAIHRMTTLAEAGFMPNLLTKTASVLSQTYSGDITILPEVGYVDFPKVLSNPTPQFIIDAMLKGERATWPKLSRIRNHCAIELALDNAANEVRARAVFTKTQESSRRQAFNRTQSYDGRDGTVHGPARRSKLQKHSMESEPGPDILELAKKDSGTRATPSHHKAKSTQISELLAKATVSPSLVPQEIYDFCSGPQAEDVSSSGPGLTSDASEGEDDTSISSGEETCTGDIVMPLVDDTIRPTKSSQSISVPGSPVKMHKRSPFFWHFPSKSDPQGLASNAEALPQTRRQSPYDHEASHRTKARAKSLSEPQANRWSNKKSGLISGLYPRRKQAFPTPNFHDAP